MTMSNCFIAVMESACMSAEQSVLHSGACSITVIRWRERVLRMCTFKIAIIDYGYRCEGVSEGDVVG